jgi:hypothetical protein
MSEKILNAFKFPSDEKVNFQKYCELLEKFLARPMIEQSRLAFSLHD